MRRRSPTSAYSAASSAVRSKLVRGGLLLAVGVSLAACSSAAKPSAASMADHPGSGASASVQPSGSQAAAAAVLAPASAAGTQSAVPWPSSVVTAGPDGLLGIPSDASPSTDNSTGPLSLNALIDKFYGPASAQSEKSLYVQWGFVSGGFEGWLSDDNSRQSIAIARFGGANGATSAFDDLSNNLRQKPAPSTVVTDSADGAVGSADPTLDSQGNAVVDITARVGDYVVEVQDFTAATPDPTTAEALLLKQIQALTPDS
jgi:hypothetical protein